VPGLGWGAGGWGAGGALGPGTGWTAGAPTGGSPSAPLTSEQTGISRLLQQFREVANPLIRALQRPGLQHLQIASSALLDTMLRGWVGAPANAQLDLLGAVLGIYRNSRPDIVYATAIAAQLLTLRSNGTVEEIYSIFCTLALGNNAQIQDLPLDPAGFRYYWTSPILSVLTGYSYRIILKRARAAGVKAWYYFWPAPGNTLYTLSDTSLVASTTLGLSDVNNPLSGGGVLAAEVNA